MKKKFRMKNAFVTILISYLAILMIPAVVIGVVFAKANQLSAQRCVDNTQNQIAQGKLLLERQLEMMDSSAVSLTYDPMMKWALGLGSLEPGDRNVYRISQLQDHLDNLFGNSLFMEDYSVILNNDFVFTGSSMIQGRDFYFDNYRNYQELTKEQWMERSFCTIGRQLIPLQNIKMGRTSVRAMTYSYSILGYLEGLGQGIQEADAAVQFLIPETTLNGYFLPLLQEDGCFVTILDGQGSPVAMLGGESTESRELPLPKVEEMRGTIGDYKIKSDQGDWAVVYRRSDANDLIYAAVLPKSVLFGDVRELWAVSVLLLTVSILTELGLGVVFAWKYTQPFRNLIRNIQRMIAPPTEEFQKVEGSEYEQLEKGFHYIVKTNETMKLELREKEKQNFLTFLFNGEFRSNENIIREGELAGVEFSSPGYCVIAFATGSQTEEIYLQALDQSWTFALAFYIWNRETLLMLTGINTETGLQEQYCGSEVLRWIGSRWGLKIPAGVGKVYSEVSDIVYSSKQACYSLNASEKYPGQDLVSYGQLSQDLNALYYPSEIEEKLINSTKQGETTQIRSAFSVLRKENTQKRYLSATMANMLISSLAATLFQICNDVIYQEESGDFTELLYRQPSLTDSLEVLERQFLHVSSRLAESKDERDELYQNRLREYVETHYSNSQLGIVMAAEAFSLSENYFSQFFKDMMGDGFSNYLEQVRLNQAKKLIEEGRHDLEDIASMVGYNNSGTFRRAFKRVTGVSPSAWKQMKKE